MYTFELFGNPKELVGHHNTFGKLRSRWIYQYNNFVEYLWVADKIFCIKLEYVAMSSKISCVPTRDNTAYWYTGSWPVSFSLNSI